MCSVQSAVSVYYIAGVPQQFCPSRRLKSGLVQIPSHRLGMFSARRDDDGPYFHPYRTTTARRSPPASGCMYVYSRIMCINCPGANWRKRIFRTAAAADSAARFMVLISEQIKGRRLYHRHIYIYMYVQAHRYTAAAAVYIN